MITRSPTFQAHSFNHCNKDTRSKNTIDLAFLSFLIAAWIATCYKGLFFRARIHVQVGFYSVDIGLVRKMIVSTVLLKKTLENIKRDCSAPAMSHSPTKIQTGVTPPPFPPFVNYSSSSVSSRPGGFRNRLNKGLFRWVSTCLEWG